jgi:hypothetical protein
MSTIKIVAWCALLAIGSPSLAGADTLTVASGSGPWTYFFAPNSSAAGYLNQTVSGQPVTSSGSGGSSGTATPVPSPSGSWSAFAASWSSSPTLTSSGTYDAFVNFGTAPYSEASVLTTGTSQPWYTSPSVTKAFGGTPDAAQQGEFTSQVLSDVQKTFALAGMSPQITIDPTVPANHVISVVSGLSYGPNPNAIGITDVGHDGFEFIDKLDYANNPTDLAWAVAHNVSHELMHAFGIAIHPDQTGQYIDAASTTWTLLTNPNATFSPGAVQLITATDYGSPSASPDGVGSSTSKADGGQEILVVPEPSTIAAWSFIALGLLYQRRRLRSRSAA